MRRFYPVTLLLLFVLILPCAAQQPFWEPAGPPSGRFSQLTLDSSGRLYARALYKSDLFASEDNGKSWSVRWLSFSTNRRSITTVAQGNTLIAARSDGEIARSADGGFNWESLDTLPSQVTALAALPAGGLLAGTYQSGRYISRDSGRSWQQEAHPDLQITCIAVGAGRIVTAGSHGLTVSTDRGETWSDIPFEANLITELAIAPDGALYVATDARLVRSTDQGTTWEDLVEYDGFATAIGLASDGSVLLSIRLPRINNRDPYTGYLLRSSRGTAPWDTVESIDRAATSFVLDKAGALLASTAEGVIRSTDNGITWELLPVSSETLLELAVAADGRWLSTPENRERNLQLLYSSPDGGNNWLVLDTTEQPIERLTPSPRGPIYCSSWGSLRRSSAPDWKWMELPPPRFGTTEIGGGYSYGTDRHGDLYVIHEYRGAVMPMLVSTDDGESWTRRIDVPDSTFDSLHPSKITGPFFGRNGEIFVCNDGDYPRGYRGGFIHLSTNGGESWEAFGGYHMPRYVVAHPEGALFIGNGYELRRSYDLGRTSDSLPFHVRSLVVAPNGDLIALHEDIPGTGIYRSSDLGSSWQIMDTSFVSHAVTRIALDSTGRLVAATDGLGIMRGPTFTSGIREDVGSVATDGILTLTVTPQPAVDRAVISFTLDHTESVRLEIFDAAGAQIARLIDRTLPAGRESITWNTEQVDAGVYLVRIVSHGRTSTGKVVVVR